MKRNAHGSCIAAVWIGLCVGLAPMTRAWDEPEVSLEAYSTLSTNFVTPHTPWARPYAGGTLRGVYFVYSRSEGMQTHAREAVELQQRLDITLDAAFLYNFYREHWFGGDAGERRAARLMAEPRDVFIFQDMPPSKLSTNALQDARTPFLKQVRDGAGVVLIGTDDGKLFTEAQDLTDPPPLLVGTGVVKVYTVGKGRVAQMPARPRIGYRAGWEVEYDYWQEALTRAVLWAARREPVTRVQVAVDPALDRQELPAKDVTVAWQGATAGETALAARLRRWDGETRELGTVTCDRADGQTVFELPRSRGGAYHVEVFARNGTGVQGWATAPLEITAASRIAALTLDAPYPLPERPPALNPKSQKAWDAKTQARHEEAERRGVYTPYVEVGEMITGKVTAEGTSPGQVLRVSLRDPRGRELVRRELPTGGEQSFQFKAETWMPALLRVEATLWQGDEEVASDLRDQRITTRRQGQFNFVLWSAPGDETLGPYALEKLADMGVTTILEHTSPALSYSAYGMSYVPWSGGGGNVILQSVENWQNPESNKGFARGWGMNARGAGALTYSLGDEIPTHGMGKGPNTDAYFQAYLRHTYGELARLNQNWESSFVVWDQITVKAAEAQARQSAARNNHAPGYDLHYFPGYNFVQMGKQWRDGVREVCADPHAKIGFEGSAHIARGMADPELICRDFDMWVPYTSISEEFIRSVAPRSFIRSSWIGYDKDAISHLGHYWRQIMMGADSVWYWMWSAIGGWQGLQQPDLDAPGPVREMLADTQIIRDGLGDLLLKYEMQHDGVAMLYSYPSLFVHNHMTNAKSYPGHWAAYIGTGNLVHDLNMQYHYVTEQTLTSGAFAKAGYKVLLLPLVWAMGDETITAIRQFVADGGTVIADLRPGFYNQHCRPRGSAALDDLFGVRGAASLAAAKSESLNITGQLGLSKLEFKRPGPGQNAPVVGEPGLELTTGQALGSVGTTPAFVVNEVGKGRAILLNFVLRSAFVGSDDPGVGGLSGKPTMETIPEDAARFFLGLFHAAGVERAFNFTEYKKETVPYFRGVRVQRWRNGDYEIAGFFRQVDTEQRRGAFIPDSEKWPVSPQRQASDRPYAPYPHVYDIKHGLTVGQANWLIVPLDPGRAVFYAMLPGPLPSMAVDIAKTARCGVPVRIKLSVPDAHGLHAIKIRAWQPDGMPAKFWEQTVQVGKAPIEVVLPLAFNDPVGEWAITLTDLFGMATAQKMAVKVDM